MTSCAQTDPRHGFVRRLAAAHGEQSPSLTVARHWRVGDGDEDVRMLVGDAHGDDYFWFATTAKLYALWHSGRPAASDGSVGHGIGQWTRQLGVRDPRAQRLLRRIVDAGSAEELAAILVVLASKRTRHAPHWDTVVDELLGWAVPTNRTGIRFAWGQDFYRHLAPKTPTGGVS